MGNLQKQFLLIFVSSVALSIDLLLAFDFGIESSLRSPRNILCCCTILHSLGASKALCTEVCPR